MPKTKHDRPSYEGSASWTKFKALMENRFGHVIELEPEESWFEWRGHQIHLDSLSPNGTLKGTLILVHGAGGHGRLLTPLGAVAAEHGWKVLAPDLPGYGLTITRPKWQADYQEWPELVAELAAKEEGPVVLLGMSVGGMTAFRSAQMLPNLGGVIATNLLDMSDPAIFKAAARWPWLGALSLQVMKFAPWLMDVVPMPLSLVTPLDAMTSDPELRTWFKRDPLIGARWVMGRFFRSLHQYVPPRSDFALPCPLLLIHPGADEWTPTRVSLRVFDQVSSPKHFQELSNGSHMPAEAPAWLELRDGILAFLAKVDGEGGKGV
ncbi:MAG: alpha/beta hydrolase [Aquidulcibacter sp.]|uniref:alpha/beta hydrolase n=1 Tax=Aquidulcibacter sp. TaxID=2052990 RepID=UPI0022C8C9C6|nr:alpha/beta hydrolase [Aquidulcibacter sp.]